MGRKLAMGMVLGAALGLPVVGAVRAQNAPSPPPPAGPGTTAAASDQAISGEIKDALSAKTGMRNASISVTTHDGVVTLTGTVASREMRQTAVDVARETAGVSRVEDHLRLVGNTPADPEVPAP